MRRLLTAMALFVSHAAWADPPMTPEEAFATGKASGDQSTVQSVFNSINGTKGGEVVTGYSTGAPEASYWSSNADIASTIVGGAGKIAECEGTESSDPKLKNQCEAILALKKLQTTMPPGLVTASDPLIVRGDAITANPDDIAGTITNNYSECTTKTETVSATKTTETCDEYSTTGPSLCTVGASVTVDADHLYKCLDTKRVTANSSCTVGRIVEIDADANYQCYQNLKTTTSETCKKIVQPTIKRSYDFTMGVTLTCTNIMTGSDTFTQLTTMQARANTAFAQGKTRIYKDSTYVMTTGSVPRVSRSDDEYTSWVALWVNNVNVANGLIGANTLKMCGSNYCSAVTPTLGGGGPSDIIGYTCSGTSPGSGCPTGFTLQSSGACLENSYTRNMSDPACKKVRTVATSIPGTASATEYAFVCASIDNQCADMEARAQ